MVAARHGGRPIQLWPRRRHSPPADAIILREIYSGGLGEKSLWAPRTVPHQCLVSSNIERYFVDLAAQADEVVLRTLEHKTLADILAELLPRLRDAPSSCSVGRRER